MDQLKRFVWPIATGGSVLVIALIALDGLDRSRGQKGVYCQRGQDGSPQSGDQPSGRDILTGARVGERAETARLREDLTLVPGYSHGGPFSSTRSPVGLPTRAPLLQASPLRAQGLQLRSPSARAHKTVGYPSSRSREHTDRCSTS